MKTKNLSRRTFLKGAGLAVAAPLAVPLAVPSSVFGDENKAAPSERITVAHIGAGGLGRMVFSWTQRVKEAQSVAVADCFKSRRDGVAAACKGKAYLDYREILQRDDIDAVLIITPDHWHVPIALEACKAKKHTHVAKPLGLSLGQNAACRKAFAESGLTFQYGTQQRSMPHCWKGCELVRRGVIGAITALEVDAPNGGAGGSTAEAPIPADLGEDGYAMWTGPGAKRPYTNDRCRGPGTYWIYDYSIGYLAGWGAHPLDMMVWGSEADLSGPVVVEGTGVVPAEGLYDVVYNWNMNIRFGTIPFTFKTGSDRTRFIGETGWIEVRRGAGVEGGDPNAWGTNMESKGLSASDPKLLQIPLGDKEPLLKRTASANHIDDFIRSIKSGEQPGSTLKDALRSDNISHLCDIAVRTQSAVRFDPLKQELIAPTKEQQAIADRAV
ncbi:MAG: Gfo/Idh/MocA family oxidoreductase [Planctomycetaceae bacterium]|jgi:predicted dehydrogenase|nr:Gfo/Idh/MocA family oxidoreductase [Planctomycetaceae bacterium]